jgi:MFS family permease
MSLVTTPLQLYIARFLLGAAEAGFVPGVILYLTYWFPAEYRARITSIFFMAITFAGILGGPVSGYILQNFTTTTALKSWQWMFIIEGLPAALLGIVAYFYLDDGPESAAWLSSSQKEVIRNDLISESMTAESGKEHSLKKALCDPKVYIAGFVYFGIIAGNNALTLWMPSLIRRFGVSDLFVIGLLSALPYICGAVAMMITSRHSDKHRERRWHVAIPLLVTALAYAIVGYMLNSPATAIATLAIAAGGIYSAFGIFWTIPPAYLSGAAAAGGIGIVSSVGMMGGFASPLILGWAAQADGSLRLGYQLIAAILVFAVIFLLLGISKKSLIADYQRKPKKN